MAQLTKATVEKGSDELEARLAKIAGETEGLDAKVLAALLEEVKQGSRQLEDAMVSVVQRCGERARGAVAGTLHIYLPLPLPLASRPNRRCIELTAPPRVDIAAACRP
eukprot:SAG22_NODE_571_length_9011_cov_292.011670_12_plen_108_part_00